MMTMTHTKQHHAKSPLRSRSVIIFSLVLIIAISGIWTIYNVHSSPTRALGGVIWFSNGPNYISDSEVSDRIKQLNAPAELKMSEAIAGVTQACDAVEGGLCTQSLGVYVDKEMDTPAVNYVPAIPDRKEVIGYCTACNDGTWSPSCAVGRGACSYHSGVAAYNVPEYKTVYGTAAIAAQAATYTYTPKTYQDSIDYLAPVSPTLDMITKFKTD